MVLGAHGASGIISASLYNWFLKAHGLSHTVITARCKAVKKTVAKITCPVAPNVELDEIERVSAEAKKKTYTSYTPEV